jgi:hypothetical protein
VRLETNKLSRVEILRLPPTRGEINVQEIKVGIDSECAKRTADVSYVKSEATPLQYRSSGIGFFLCDKLQAKTQLDLAARNMPCLC